MTYTNYHDRPRHGDCFGNCEATDGLDRCGECDFAYWENDRCVGCGKEWDDGDRRNPPWERWHTEGDCE